MIPTVEPNAFDDIVVRLLGLPIMTAREYIDGPPPGWFVLDVMQRELDGQDWVALLIDTDPDDLQARRSARQCWVNIPGQHDTRDTACDALEVMLLGTEADDNTWVLCTSELGEGLPQTQQERRKWCGCDLRGGDAAVDAVRRDQDAGAAERLDTAPGRQLLVRQRTMLSNALRGHLAELGIVSAKGRNGTAELATYFAPEGSGLTARQVAGQLGSLGHEVEILSSSKICLTRFTRHVRAVHDAAGAVGPYAVTPEAWDKILAAPNFQTWPRNVFSDCPISKLD